MHTAIRHASVVATLLYSAIAHPQQALVGKYEGGYEFFAPAASMYVFIPAGLEITRAADGKVTGSFEIFQYLCRGKYAVAGTYEGNKLTLQVGKGSVVDCGGQLLNLVAEGNKLSGKLAASDIELSRP